MTVPTAKVITHATTRTQCERTIHQVCICLIPKPPRYFSPFEATVADTPRSPDCNRPPRVASKKNTHQTCARRFVAQDCYTQCVPADLGPVSQQLQPPGTNFCGKCSIAATPHCMLTCKITPARPNARRPKSAASVVPPVTPFGFRHGDGRLSPELWATRSKAP